MPVLAMHALSPLHTPFTSSTLLMQCLLTRKVQVERFSSHFTQGRAHHECALSDSCSCEKANRKTTKAAPDKISALQDVNEQAEAIFKKFFDKLRACAEQDVDLPKENLNPDKAPKAKVIRRSLLQATQSFQARSCAPRHCQSLALSQLRANIAHLLPLVWQIEHFALSCRSVWHVCGESSGSCF